ncbi:tetratricopeptide repeat protein [Terasakiella pusilla]|uniref:tetratricopeptide repeat protein n=1 Tax=Terasakiella pusilla TaxID=64973 RepID=UPI003AA992FE
MTVHHQALALLRNQRFVEAKSILSRQVQQVPNDHVAWYYLSLVAYKQGEREIAIKLVDKSLSLSPRYVEALQNKGVMLSELGHWQESCAVLTKAHKLDRKNPNILSLLALSFKGAGEYGKALVFIKKAIAQDKSNPHLTFNMANIYREKGAVDEALSGYEKALLLNPQFKEAYNNLSATLIDLGRFEQALEVLSDGLATFCDDPELMFNKAKALSGQNQWLPAIECYDQVLAKVPSYTQAIVNKSNLLKRTLKYEEACTLLREACDVLPHEDVLRFNYAMVLQALGAFQAAAELLEEFTQSEGEFKETAQFNLSLNYLTRGDFVEGWRLYEARKHLPTTARKVAIADKPIWRGEPIAGRHLLVYWEQGLGDTLQFLRYLRLIDTQGGQLIFSCQKPLHRLLERLTGVDRLVIGETDLQDVDLVVPLLDLPHLFNTTLDTIPACDPDLLVPPLVRKEQNLTVGMCWKGSGTHVNDFNRSLTLDLLAPIFKTDHSFVSLQVAHDQSEVISELSPYDVEDLGSGFSDFFDTYKALEKLDLVITVDTSVAHLAATMGKPVWLLIPFVSDFRWLKERDDSPWYPSVRLFRQAEIGGWSAVIDRVRTALEERDF